MLAVMMVLRGEAKHQNDGGHVVTAISTVSRNGFVGDPALTRRVIERAGELGELDDLEWLDSLRFRCRISGWAADQERGATAKRVAAHRARSNGVKRSVTDRNENRTGQNRVNDSLRSSPRSDDHDGHDAGEAAPDEAPLCHLLADLIVQNGGRRVRIGKKWATAERLLLDRDERDRSEAEQLVRWCQGNDFWRSNILSMGKFRERYDQLQLQAQRVPASPPAPRRESPSELLRAIKEATG